MIPHQIWIVGRSFLQQTQFQQLCGNINPSNPSPYPGIRPTSNTYNNHVRQIASLFGGVLEWVINDEVTLTQLNVGGSSPSTPLLTAGQVFPTHCLFQVQFMPQSFEASTHRSCWFHRLALNNPGPSWGVIHFGNLHRGLALLRNLRALYI